jgi:uncharacterized Tic20 family protein
MLMDSRFWALMGVGCLLAGWLFPVSLPVGPVTAWLVVIALGLLGYELAKRLID